MFFVVVQRSDCSPTYYQKHIKYVGVKLKHRTSFLHKSIQVIELHEHASPLLMYGLKFVLFSACHHSTLPSFICRCIVVSEIHEFNWKKWKMDIFHITVVKIDPLSKCSF